MRDPASMSTARLLDVAPEDDKAQDGIPLAVLGAVVGTASALITAIITASLIALVLSGCADGLGQPGDALDPDPPTLPSPQLAEDDLAAPPLRSPCPGSDADFAYRALRLIQGRRPYGVRELDLLAQMVRTLDEAGEPGRQLVARGLAEGDRYRQHWRGVLLDLLRIPRLGQTADIDCYARPGALSGSPELASWIRDAAPGDAPPPALAGWTMADLLGSSLALDDLSPLLRAHLIIRNARPLAGNNVDPEELERAGRVFLGRGFEAAFLGRRLECIACHDGGGATVLDAIDPAEDRSWPVLPGLEDSVYGAPHLADEASAYAVFRVAGVVDHGPRPWGAGDDCPRMALTSAEQGADPLGDPAYLGGPRGQGASVVDLEAALHRGLDRLRAEGLPAGAGDNTETEEKEKEKDPEAALAAMVAIHLADAAWREASGHRLTMSHGQPRNPIQQAVLRELSASFVGGGYSLRELLVAIATHPLLDLDEPSACAEELPALFDPFQASNNAGDLVRREDPWRLLDSAAIALGWPTMQRFPLSSGWADETLLRSLGAFIDETEPGHHGVDVVSALAWEAAVGDGLDPAWRGPPTSDGDGDVLSRLVELAAADPNATVLDLAIAVEDRILQESALAGPPSPLRAQQRAAIEGLLGLPMDAPAAELSADPSDHDALVHALRRFAGALLTTPQFTLAGAPPRPTPPPRLVLPEATARALCEALAPAILDPSELTWECDEQGLVLVAED